MIAGNVIIVAQRLALAVHFPALEYIIYGVICVLFMYIFVTPIVRIHSSPELPQLSVSHNNNIVQLRSLGHSLAKTMDYIPDSMVRKAHCNDFRRNVAMAGNNVSVLAEVIETEILCRFEGNETENVKGINQRIIDWATTTFMITAVSQNGMFDTISIIYLNIRMIADIVRASGFRPTRGQMFRIYTSVLITSLTTFIISDALDATGDWIPFAHLDDDTASEFMVDGATDDDSAFSPYAILKGIKIPGVVIGSLIDGAVNALMTLRIGFITASYIHEGSRAFKGIAAKRAIKHQAMKKALTTLPEVIGAGSSVIGKTATSVLLKIFKTV